MKQLVECFTVNRLWCTVALAQLYHWIDIDSPDQLTALQQCLANSKASSSEAGWHQCQPDVWVPVLGPQLTDLAVDTSRLLAICYMTPMPANSFSALTTLTISSTSLPLLETTHKVCPKITTLSFDIKEQPAEVAARHSILPATLITSLAILNLDVDAYAGSWLNYIKVKYPNLANLSVKFIEGSGKATLKKGTTTLYSLVCGLPRLASLHLNLEGIGSCKYTAFSILDSRSLRRWLNGEFRPHNLTSFSWFCPSRPPIEPGGSPTRWRALRLSPTSLRWDSLCMEKMIPG
ncbi:hypothetical protein DM01DRAFT_1378254 [Hesseltinella vesiculosa]|uniref:F-box domain-containing protein n=1 Tax=Hesseltinella vesiculosa TaxID=101127 RepID=A0A1X2G4K3_9FUNG|nr:hypothetical protein DM01DRAFT_1378254 [Hesseltinella vesiculosa]